MEFFKLYEQKKDLKENILEDTYIITNGWYTIYIKDESEANSVCNFANSIVMEYNIYDGNKSHITPKGDTMREAIETIIVESVKRDYTPERITNEILTFIRNQLI